MLQIDTVQEHHGIMMREVCSMSIERMLITLSITVISLTLEFFDHL